MAAWGLSIVFSIPAIYLNEETMVKGHPQCWINLDPWQWKVYISFVATSIWLIPACIITACYAVIVSTIWRKGRSMPGGADMYTPVHSNAEVETASKSVATTIFTRQSSSGATDSTGVSSSISRRTNETTNSHENEFKRASSRGVIPRAKIKSVKMTLVIVFGQ